MNRKFTSTEDMINRLKVLKGKSKLKFYRNFSNYYDEMNYRRQSEYCQFEEDPFAKKAQVIANNMHEVLLIMKFLQTKPQVKSKNIHFYDLYLPLSNIGLRGEK